MVLMVLLRRDNLVANPQYRAVENLKIRLITKNPCSTWARTFTLVRLQACFILRRGRRRLAQV